MGSSSSKNFQVESIFDSENEKFVDLGTMNKKRMISVKSKNEQPYFVYSGTNLMGAPQFWYNHITGEGQKLGILDGGIDRSHPDLKESVLSERSFVSTSEGLSLESGTFLAGVAAAKGTLLGAAPSAKVNSYVIKSPQNDVMQSNVRSMSEAIERATSENDILLISVDVPSFAQDHIGRSMKTAIDNDCHIIMPADKNGPSVGSMTSKYPFIDHYIMYINAIEFNVTTRKVEAHQISTKAQKSHVDFCADGVDVISCYPGGKYIEKSGNEIAAAQVAGGALLFKEKLKSIRRNSKFVSSLYGAMVIHSKTDIVATEQAAKTEFPKGMRYISYLTNHVNVEDLAGTGYFFSSTEF